jgi:hypothetical protein
MTYRIILLPRKRAGNSIPPSILAAYASFKALYVKIERGSKEHFKSEMSLVPLGRLYRLAHVQRM